MMTCHTRTSSLHTTSNGRTLLVKRERVASLGTRLAAGEAAFVRGEFGAARAAFAPLLQSTPAPAIVLAAARAELALGQTDRCISLTMLALRRAPTCAAAFGVRGEALALTGDFEQALKLLREGIALDPDASAVGKLCKRVRRLRDYVVAARAAKHARRFDGALAAYGDALAVGAEMAMPKRCALWATLHAERAEAKLRLKRYDAALKDAAIALYARDDDMTAWMARLGALHALGRHDEALADAREAHAKRPSDPLAEHALERATFEARKAKRPDYYAAVGVKRVATEAEIKAAYKRRALECHPDKVPPGADADTRAKATVTFKALGEALEVLGDEQKRRFYDEGYDKAAIEARIEAANRAANNTKHSHHHHR